MEPVGQGVPKRMQIVSEKGEKCPFSGIWKTWLPFVISRSRVRVTSLAPPGKGLEPDALRAFCFA